MEKKRYFVMVKPEVYGDLRGALEFILEASPRVGDKRTAKRILKELEGIGEIRRGLARQMSLTTREMQLLRDIGEAYELPLRIGD